MSTNGNDKFIQLQHQIRQNSYSVQDYVSELTEWTQEINEKDSDAKLGKGAKIINK
jgi:formylglycine-generating enzyme required for sulfatase activity